MAAAARRLLYIWRLRRGAVAALGFAALFPILSAAHAAVSAPSRKAPATEAHKAQLAQLVGDADKAMKDGQVELALIQIKNAVRLAPDNGTVRARYGAILLAAGQAAAAEPELRRALADHGARVRIIPALLDAMLRRNEMKELLKEFSDPPAGTKDALAPDILIARAFALQNLGQAGDARAAMDRSLGLRRNAAGLVGAARLAQQQHGLADARRLVDEALKRDPRNEDALATSVVLYRQTGDPAKALAAADAFVRKRPKSPTAKVLRIGALIEAKRYGDAKAQIDALASQEPGAPYVTYYRGVLQARARNFRGAWLNLQSLTPEFVQSDAAIAMMVARVAVANNYLQTAGAILTTVVARHPDLKDARFELAAFRLTQNAPQKALELLSPYSTSTDPVAHGLLAQAYLKLKRFDEALHSLEIAVASPNANDLLKQQLASTQLQLGDTAEAIDNLTALAKRDPSNLAVAGALIAAYVRDARWQDALDVADRLGRANTHSPMPGFFRGVVLASRGTLREAAAAFERSLAIDPKFLPSLYYHADVAIALGEAVVARKDLERVLAHDPKNTVSYVKLAQIALAGGDEKKAVFLLDAAIRVAPKDPTPRLALANYQFARHRYGEAELAVKGLLRTAGDNPEGLALKSQLEFQRGATGEAVKTLRALASAHPDSPFAFELLARALYATHDLAGALDAAQNAVDLAPTSPQTRASLIEIKLAAGKSADALSDARSYDASAPGPAADVLLAQTLDRIGRTAEAQAVLKKSLAKKPDPRVVLALSRMHMAHKDVKSATNVLADWTARHDDFAVRREYAALLLQSGDLKTARKEYEVLVAQRPDDPTILNNLGWLLQRDDPARALALVSRAARIAPNSAAIADMLGWLEYQRNDRRGALAHLERAHKIDAANPAIAYHLALVLDANGRRAEAKALLQKTLEHSPDFQDAARARAVLAHW